MSGEHHFEIWGKNGPGSTPPRAPPLGGHGDAAGPGAVGGHRFPPPTTHTTQEEACNGAWDTRHAGRYAVDADTHCRRTRQKSNTHNHLHHVHAAHHRHQWTGFWRAALGARWVTVRKKPSAAPSLPWGGCPRGKGRPPGGGTCMAAAADCPSAVLGGMWGRWPNSRTQIGWSIKMNAPAKPQNSNLNECNGQETLSKKKCQKIIFF